MSPHLPSLNLELSDTAATESLGASLASAIEAGADQGLVIWLSGQLGAGKTTLTRGLLRALGHMGNVKSPTYTLLEPYVVSRIHLYHFDFYRFNDPAEFLEAGLEEYFGNTGICLVEWADKALPHVPRPDIEIRLEVSGDGRHAELHANNERGHACLSACRLASPPP